MKYHIIHTIILSAMLFSLFACTDNERDFYLNAPTTDGTNSFPVVDLSPLHIEGRFLKNASGEAVNLHGFAQTYSPYFNKSAWSNYDVDACLAYNQKCIDGVLSAGWKVNFIRQHMDPYWSSPGAATEAQAYAFYDRKRFEKYLDLVFVPMAEYAIKRGLYVVMRPPGVSPEVISVNDDYNNYLIEVWDIISNHPKIKNNPGIMFEIANEPVDIVGTDGSIGRSTDAQFAALSQFLQPIVDVIRDNDCRNIVWLPGLGYQSCYSGFVSHPVEDDNMGYAIHCYCGWYGSDGQSEEWGESGGGYTGFQQGWDAQITPVANQSPILVTEMDWAPAEYNSSWGKGTTGTAGGRGFGANFKYIVDNTGNVSWLLFTDQEYLTQFVDEEGMEGEYTFLNDPEACPWPVYHWFEEYVGIDEDHGALTQLVVLDASDNTLSISTGSEKHLLIQAKYSDGHVDLVTSKCEMSSSAPDIIRVNDGKLTAVTDGEADIVISYTYKEETYTTTLHVTSSNFALSDINPHIWDPENLASYKPVSQTLITAPYGFGGWQYTNGLDLSSANYLIVELNEGTNVNGNNQFRIFDVNDYWTEDHAEYSVNDYRLVIDLKNMTTINGKAMDPSHLYIIGFWTMGGKENAMVINKVYTSLTEPTAPYIPSVPPTDPEEPDEPDTPDTPEDKDLFPLSDIKTDIWEHGSFNETTHELLTGVCGFCGWSKEGTGTSWDLTRYKYLVVELGSESACDKNGWSFRLFDNGYWGGQVEIAMADEVKDNRLVVDLTKTILTADGRALDLSNVNIIGFWSFGDPDPIYVEKVYVTNELN